MNDQSPFEALPNATTFSVPMIFNEPSRAQGFNAKGLRIDYTIEKEFAKQSRYQDRVLLRPEVDLRNYRFEAVIDWVEVSFELSPRDRTSQALNIQKKLRKFMDTMRSNSTIFVSGSARKEGFQGRLFVFRLQDPDAKELQALLGYVENEYVLDDRGGDPFRLVGLEIAFDAYPLDDDLMDDEALDYRRWQMTNLFWRHLRFDRAYAEKPNDAARYFTDPPPGKKAAPKKMLRGTNVNKDERLLVGDPKTARMLRPSNYVTVPTDGMFCMGAKGGPVMFRVMDKIPDGKDQHGRVRKHLGRNERRARIEASLMIDPGLIEQSEGLHLVDIYTPDDLFGFKFHDWSQTFFKFYLPTLSLVDGNTDRKEGEMFTRAGLVGLEHYQALRRDIRAGRKPSNGVGKALGAKEYLMAFSDLTEKAREELRKLSRRWK